MIKNFIFDNLIILAVPFMIKTSLKTNLIFFSSSVYLFPIWRHNLRYVIRDSYDTQR